MIAATPTDDIVVRQTEIIRRDAEALLAVAAWADLPAGAAVLPLIDRPEAGGLSMGSGHLLAVANGCRPGAVAVRVDVAQPLRMAIEAAPDSPDAAVAVVRPIVEGVVVHEAAHALVAVLDAAADADQARQWVAACDALPVRTGADAHGPRWGAAVVVLTRRMIALRPPGEQLDRESLLRADLQNYGLDADAIAEALGDVADEVPLRELLAVGGDVACRVAAACRPEAERQRLIEHRRQHGAADEGDGVSGERAGA